VAPRGAVAGVTGRQPASASTTKAHRLDGTRVT
jgi:hypothetical protein